MKPKALHNEALSGSLVKNFWSNQQMSCPLRWVRRGCLLAASGFFWFSGSVVAAQVIEPLLSEEFTGRHYINTVRSIACPGETPEVWVGSSNGAFLVSERGRSVKGIVVKDIVCHAGEVWFATPEGMRFDELHRSVSTDQRQRRTIEGDLTRLWVEGDTLWVGGVRLLAKWTESKGYEHFDIDGTVNDLRTVLDKKGESYVLVATSSRFYRLFGDSESSVAIGAKANYTKILTSDSAATFGGDVWVAGLYMESGEQLYDVWKLVDPADSSAVDLIRLQTEEDMRLVDWVHGELWVGSQQRLRKWVSGDLGLPDSLEWVDIEYPMSQYGEPLQIFARAGDPQIFLRTTAGFYRQKEEGEPWEYYLPTNRPSTMGVWMIGEPAKLWLAEPGKLSQIHWDTELVFHLEPSIALLGPLNELVQPWGRRLIFSFRNKLAPSRCSYRGSTLSKVPIKSDCSDAEFLVLTDSREARNRIAHEWRWSDDDSKPPAAQKPSAFLSSLHGEVADSYGNYTRRSFWVVSPTVFQFIGLLLALTMICVRRARQFAFSFLEIVFGSKILSIVLRIPIFASLYMEGYCRNAAKQVEYLEDEDPIDYEDLATELIDLSSEHRLVGVLSRTVSPDPALLEKAFLENRLQRGAGWKVFSGRSLKQEGMQRIPLRVDFSFNSDSLEEIDAYVVKRLKSLGGMEQRIAEYLWEHADFLILLSVPEKWDASSSLWRTMVKFVLLQNEDLDARFVLLGLDNSKTNEEWEEMLAEIYVKPFTTLQLSE